MRVIIAEDERLYRDMLVQILSSHGFEVIGEAGSIDELLVRVDATPPDLVLLDIRMPSSSNADGVHAALQICARHPQVAIVLLSKWGEVDYAMQLGQGLRERAGYVLKERATSTRELLDIIEQVVGGGLYIDPGVGALLIGKPRRNNPLDQLTQRERETLTFVAQGLSNAAIAKRMDISVAGVEKHVTAVFDKLELRSHQAGSPLDANARVMAVLVYLRYTRQFPNQNQPSAET